MIHLLLELNIISVMPCRRFQGFTALPGMMDDRAFGGIGYKNISVKYIPASTTQMIAGIYLLECLFYNNFYYYMQCILICDYIHKIIMYSLNEI